MIWQLIRSSAATAVSVECAPLLVRYSLRDHSSCCSSKANAYQVSARASRDKMEFCGVCFDCRRKGEQKSRFLKASIHTSSCFFYDSKKYTWLQYKKRQIQAPGATFASFRGGIRLQGGHGNCCRFATFTRVHQGAHMCLAKLWFKGKGRSEIRITEYPTGKIER